MSEPIHVSASQISRARGCVRRWAWERVAPLPKSAQLETMAELGKAVHKISEDYQNHGTMPDRTTSAGRIFMPALPFLPAPGKAQCELEINMSEPRFLGYVDMLAPAYTMPGDWPACHHVILDYKTKETFKSRGMFQGLGDFLTDPQALGYAWWYFNTFPDFDRVGLRWLYLRRTGRPAAKPCDAIIMREKALEAFDRLVRPLAQELVQLRSRPVLDPLTLEPNPLECTRYGARYACPYIPRCGLTVSQRVQGAMAQHVATQENKPMSLIDDLRAQFGNKGVNPPDAAQADTLKPGLPGYTNPTKTPPVTLQAQATDKPVSVQTPDNGMSEIDAQDMKLGRALRIVFQALRG